jgi:hypothetical protein
MIAYEELCAALERYAARTRGDVSMEADASPAEPTTSEHALPPVGIGIDEGADERTHAGGMTPVFDDRSNELDIGDVLSDEEVSKN